MAKLTYKARAKLPGGAFAVDHKERKYAIHDKAHARNALARVAAHGTAAEKKKVRHEVKAKYPKIGKEGK